MHLLAYPCDNYTRVLICTKEDFREFCNPGMGNTIVLTKAISHFGHLYLLHYNFPFGIQMVVIFFSVRDPKTKKHRNLPETNMYSRVHKRWQSFFSKILEKPSIVQKKMLPHIKGLDYSQRWSKKKIQNGRLRKFKMAASKKTHFPAPPILNIFSWNSHGLDLGLVELIEAKGIGLAQLIWSWGCPT